MYAKSKDVISKEEHERWFALRFSRIELEPFWIAMLKETPIGFVRFDIDGTSIMKINIAILPEYSGKGFGSDVLKLAIELLLENPQKKTIRAEVHVKNEPSLRLFRKLGFVDKKSDQNFISFDYSPLT